MSVEPYFAQDELLLQSESIDFQPTSLDKLVINGVPFHAAGPNPLPTRYTFSAVITAQGGCSFAGNATVNGSPVTIVSGTIPTGNTCILDVYASDPAYDSSFARISFPPWTCDGYVAATAVNHVKLVLTSPTGAAVPSNYGFNSVTGAFYPMYISNHLQQTVPNGMGFLAYGATLTEFDIQFTSSISAGFIGVPNPTIVPVPIVTA